MLDSKDILTLSSSLFNYSINYYNRIIYNVNYSLFSPHYFKNIKISALALLKMVNTYLYDSLPSLVELFDNFKIHNRQDKVFPNGGCGMHWHLVKFVPKAL